ncbi:flagellar biosynthetic protein FliR [bacterium]|nr:flagellar biosynthetic protein FliR [bacterium]
MSVLEKIFGINVDYFAAFITWALLLTRILVVLLLIPFMGGKLVPARSRLATAALMATYLFVVLYPSLKTQFPDDKAILFALFFKEIFFGMTIGFVTMMTFYALEGAGRIVDMQRGTANAMLFMPQLGQVSIFGLFNYWLAVAFFLSIGGHRYFFEAFFSAYKILPLLTLPQIAPGFSPFLEFFIKLSANVLIIAIQLSAPVLIAILLVDVVLGIANKMAPQINVFELGFAVKGFVGPLMIYVSLLVLVSQMDVVMKTMITSIDMLAKLLAHNSP